MLVGTITSIATAGTQFVTPIMRHEKNESMILAKRHEVYEKVKAKHPTRWSGNTRNWTPISEVALNQTNEKEINVKKVA